MGERLTAEREASLRDYIDGFGDDTHEELLAELDAVRAERDAAREEAAQWYRKANQTDDKRLRAAIDERKAMQRERDEAHAELCAVRAAAGVKGSQ